MIEFRNAYHSGILMNQSGSGTYDHIGFTAPQSDPSGAIIPVAVDSWATAAYIVDGNAVPFGGQWGGAPSGQMTNTQYNTDTTCNLTETTISRATTTWSNTLISDINTFDSSNLGTYPTFRNEGSGVLAIHFDASGLVHTYDTELYATEKDGARSTNPSGMSVRGFEISPSGHTHDGVGYQWVYMSGNSPLKFTDHSAESGWLKQSRHVYVAALSMRPDQLGILPNTDFFFTVTYA